MQHNEAGGSGPDFPIDPLTAPLDVDSRPPVSTNRRTPPVTGGTLLALSDARRALVSDPDRDRMWLVDYAKGALTALLTLEPGAEPTRAVEDKAGHAYVLLRGTGEVLTINLNEWSAGERRRVCSSPRGIVLEPSGDKLLVACAEGKLVQLPLSGSVLGEARVPLDARDVVFLKDQLYVSRFRSSELLELDPARAVLRRTQLPTVSGNLNTRLSVGDSLFEPAVAWRAVAGPSSNSVVIVHQRATASAIMLPPAAEVPSTDGMGGPVVSAPVVGGAAYGGDSSGCGGIVQSAVTVVADGVVVTSPQLPGVVLPVDVAVSSDGIIAVASAGTADLPVSNVRGFPASSGNALTVLSGSNLGTDAIGCLPPNFGYRFEQPLVAVAFEPVAGGRLLAVSRQPLGFFVISEFRDGVIGGVTSIPITAESVEDTGHEIFHRDSGGGIACASCHPEGTDDGRTWEFDPIGPRRSQPIDVGLADTAPFHWDGDLGSVGKLMGEVFVRRMGGPIESPERINALESWLFGLRPRAPLRASSDPAAERGRALFTSSEVGCSSCHTGPKLTNNATLDVGTGGRFQVPSLLGVGQRVPLMHNGCAATVRDRFNPACGGTAHGNTGQLGESQLLDLVAYLESI